MKDFDGRIAVITGGGTGMGRALARQLTAAGCHTALCDVSTEAMAQTLALCREQASESVRISTHVCDVADEAQVQAFRDAVCQAHETDHIHLVFNNAGIGGGGSFIDAPREEWDRTFAVCWNGVYYCTRALLPLLIASSEGVLVNTSSVNGFWASLGPGVPHTAYSAAKFAVKGFSEALINDLRVHAPHVRVALVMPGHVGTSIAENSARMHGHAAPHEMSAEAVAEVRAWLVRRGLPVGNEPDDAIRKIVEDRRRAFVEDAPTTADQAAAVILDGVRSGHWRILIGDDAHALDRNVREHPEQAYELDFRGLGSI